MRSNGLTKLAYFAPLLLVFLALPAPTGSPWPIHVIDNSFDGADGVRLADVNGDGFQDIATGWEEGGIVRVYLNPGSERVAEEWPAVTVGRVGSPEDAVFADLDGDGATDVVSCCEGKVRTVWVHWAPNEKDAYPDPDRWTTEAFPQTKGTAHWMFCLPMQIDGKNGVDLVLGAKGKGAQIGWLESPADPRKLEDWRWHPLYDAGWIMSLVASDMDSDGDLDILTSDRRGPNPGCLWLENPGVGPTQKAPWRKHEIGASGKEVMFLTRCDLDDDGREDILTAIKGKELVFLRGTGPGKWEPFPIRIPENAGTGKGVAVADVNLDGSKDIVFSCEHAKDKSGVMWMSHSGDPRSNHWEAHDISGPCGTKYDLVELLDLDRDGDLDVLTCEERERLGVVWYENPSTGDQRW